MTTASCSSAGPSWRRCTTSSTPSTLAPPGRLVLIAGEAGVGKTALIHRFCDDASRRARVLWGACDPLFTPRPLGPLFDVAGEVGGALEAFVFGGGAPHEIIGPISDALRSRVPTVFVLEDVHWADEPTLDVLRLLARRLEALPALVVVTYRDDELGPAQPLHIDELLASGMLVAADAGVSFRHEIARLTVEQALAPHRRLTLHERALAALTEPPGGGARDLPRLAHHAEAAGDLRAVVRFAPAAAAHAADRGAHREAAATTRSRCGSPTASRKRRARSCSRSAPTSAISSTIRPAQSMRSRPPSRVIGSSATNAARRSCSPRSRTSCGVPAGRPRRATARTGPSDCWSATNLGRDLAFAWAVLAQLYMDAGEFDVACDFAGRARALAERLDEADVRLHADITLQMSTLMLGDDAARGRLEAARDLAARSGRRPLAGRAWLLLAWTSLSRRAHATFDGDVTRGLDHARRHGIDLYELYLTAYRSRWQLYQGDWDQALDSAATVLRHTQVSRTPRIFALVVTGLIAARRGEPGAVELVDEALAIAVPSNELQRVGAAAAGRAELAWLEGDRAAVDRATAEALAFTECRHAPWLAGELLAWRHRGGLDAEPAPGLPEPYAAELASDWRRAAACWDEAGCRYEAALARAGDEAAQRDALAEFHALGAAKTAAMVARRLREQGARGLPRGPRKATQSNPGRLTAREVEVLRLVTEGLHNSEIAGRLFVSEKTVSHHVSAILRKLEVRTRGQASLEAVRLGLIEERRDHRQ